MPRPWLAALTLCVACGRAGFDLAATAADARAADALGDAADASGDAAGPICWEQWKAGTVQVTAPALVFDAAALGANAIYTPSLTDGDLTMYLAVVIGAASPDVFVSTRTAIGQPWSLPSFVSAFSSVQADGKTAFSEDRLTAIQSTNRTGGDASETSLWRYTRTSIMAAWSGPTEMGMSDVNLEAAQYTPQLIGSDLYFTAADGTQLSIEHSTTADGITYAPSSTVNGLGSGSAFGDPAVSPDQLVIIYGNGIPTDDLHYDDYYAARASTADRFGDPQIIPGLNDPTTEDDSNAITQDGCELYFASGRSGEFLLYEASVILP